MATKTTRDHSLTRRETLGLLGAVGATAFVGCGGDSSSAAPTSPLTHTPTGTATARPSATSTATRTATPTGTPTPETLSCVVAPALTEGPFFVDERLNRSDLTAGTSEPFVINGLPLHLKLGVYTVNGNACSPLAGAQVDVWHTSAEGVYSDEASGAIQSKNTVGETYLRGYQISDQNGTVEFRTIYPGWYMGRTIHIHLKVRIFSASGQQAFEFTSQLFIDDAINDIALANAPYNTRGQRTVRNANDGIYGTGGSQLTLDLQPASEGVGYLGTFTIGLQMS